MVVPDWRFDNRQVDLIGEGFDAGIGSGLDLKPGMVARELGRIQVVAVAAPRDDEIHEHPRAGRQQLQGD